ncbi:MAG: hypothetical protein KDK48_05790, partial [Chlamydiia bacterium]|nr:hypothetical protein [Chlamydiia bacterium]
IGMESFRIIDPLTRVKDHKYICFPDDEGLPTYLSVDESLTPPLAFEVVRRALEELGKAPFKKGESLTFECASVKWLLRTGEEKLGWLESLAGRVHAIYPQTVGLHFLITRVGGWIRTPPPLYSPDIPEVPFVFSEDVLPFSDPFTAIATVAFQRFETFITHKDGFKPSLCATRIVREGEKLLLASKEDPRAEDKELLSLWYDSLVRTHGERRIFEIFSRYELDLETFTPEHVYRVNVGLLLWDRAELTALSEKPLDALSAEEIEALMSRLELDNLSFKRALTGREIYLVKSYSTVVDSEFKPWVEAQEVAQTYQILRSNSSWSLFMEKCAHVLSKRHLARTLPEGGYRTGLLLPAPREAGKPREWYEVTWLISNPRGLHSYVLEPLWKGSKLPVLFVDRSTAQNSSALRSSESVLNDLNSLSAPGNEGRHLSEPYLNAVIDRFTIPLWVAYAVQAEKKIAEDPEQALFFLQRANSAYLKEKKKPVKRQSLRELIRRRHDVTINALYRACAAEYWKWRAAAAMQVYPALLSHVSSRSSEFADERAVAETLFRQLDECLSASSCPQLKGAVEELKQDLHYHVLYPEDGRWEEKQKEAEESLAHLSSLENERQLHRWCELLLKEAFERGEHPSQKQALALVFAGHSLGGACAQVNLVRFFAERGRMPLENCAVTGWFFQEPAINDEDNEKFKRWALKHKKLLFASGVQFSLIRREETGDIVP